MLPILRGEMSRLYGIQLSLLRIADTRSNSVQAAFTSLLRVRSAVENFVQSNKHLANFPADFLLAGNETFWSDLEIAERTIRPLTEASLRLQRDYCTMADVVHVFGKIYLGFKNGAEESDLIASVEKRWAACEQPVYILAYFLHPAYYESAKKLASTSITSIAGICDIGIFYYKRLVGGPVGALRAQIFNWIKGNLTEAKADEFESVETFWEFIKDSGFSAIGKLALIILSIVANTATCERLFSEWSNIQTAKRNRLHPQTTKKLGIVRNAVRKKDAVEDANRTTRASTNETEKLSCLIVDCRERQFKGTTAQQPDLEI